jgi:hypothetical protein
MDIVKEKLCLIIDRPTCCDRWAGCHDFYFGQIW